MRSPLHPRSGSEGPRFIEATPSEIEAAVSSAADAFEELRSWPIEKINNLLETCAESLEDQRDSLVSTAATETGLAETPRLHGELDRTVGQWRSFARMVRSGWHLEAIIDHATETHPDIRRVQVPLGPVGVFGASNFPLAFSVGGGDTASAMAAGCPVVVKAHPAHPATSEIAALALRQAVATSGAPAGTFSLIQGRSIEVGQALVTAREISAIGFTGSLEAGRSIHDLAASREVPIPVYAEMGSLNPVFITEAALRSRGDEIANGLVGSMTMGTGQFCTKPGLVFVPEENGELFAQKVRDELASLGPGPMLTPAIHGTFLERVKRSSAISGVDLTLAPKSIDGDISCSPALVVTSLDVFGDNPDLIEEHFGPMTLIVTTPKDEMVEAVKAIPGSLTATIQAEEGDQEDLADLHMALVGKAGRVTWNGFPTGVAVVPSMHHGGPYPSTTNSLHTSVGVTAVKRFMRPVSFQNTPQDLLPAALQDSNPWALRRLVDWEWV